MQFTDHPRYCNPEERFSYEESLKVYRDNKNVVDTAKDEGIAIGRTDERIKIARNLIAIGLQPEKISEATGLSIKEITAL